MIPSWLRWTLVALLSWGVWAIMARLLGGALSGAHSQALSTLGMLPVLLTMAFGRKSAPVGHPRRGVLYALAGGAISCLGNVVYYNALSRGGKAALLVPLAALYPLTTILLAMLLLRERLNRIQLGGALGSLVAIYLFNVPSEAGFLSRWLLLALAPIVLWGVSGLLQKLATRHLPSELATLWFLGAFLPSGVFFLLQSPLPAHISATTWWSVIAQGFFLALGNLAVLAAFASDGKASIVTPLAALYPVVSVPLAIGLLGERISVREAAGIALALLSVAALTRETTSSPTVQPVTQAAK